MCLSGGVDGSHVGVRFDWDVAPLHLPLTGMCVPLHLPLQPVEWTEFNAALGQAVTLLSVVSARLGYVFSKHRLVPMGSFSRIAPAGDEKAALELHYDGRLFAARRLNGGLRAFASCIGELGDYAQSVDRSFRLPYSISAGGDRVHDLPIGFGIGKDVAWTRALKLMLIDLKWLLAFACRQAE